MSEWQTMETALKEAGKEILGVKYLDGKMIRKPFISFWSPTNNQFYLSPTHWMPLPEPPE